MQGHYKAGKEEMSMVKYSPLLLLLFGNEILSLAVITVYTAVAAGKLLKETARY